MTYASRARDLILIKMCVFSVTFYKSIYVTLKKKTTNVLHK